MASTAIAAIANAQATFDVATIKFTPEHKDPNWVFQTQPGGRFVTTGITLKAVISVAYDVRDFQISGGPAWITSDLGDITAKAEGTFSGPGGRPSLDELRPMLRALMEERFQLKVRHETRDTPIYALVVARNGPKLVAGSANAAPLPVVPGMPPPPPADGLRNPYMRVGRGRMDCRKVQLKAMIPFLPGILGRPLVDKTGLDGEYDFTLTWTPEPVGGLPGQPPGPDAAPQVDVSGPSIFTAFQEQLGLRLDSQKGPVETIVIDRAERPSDN